MGLCVLDRSLLKAISREENPFVGANGPYFVRKDLDVLALDRSSVAFAFHEDQEVYADFLKSCSYINLVSPVGTFNQFLTLNGEARQVVS
jgi:hypothetical protein